METNFENPAEAAVHLLYARNAAVREERAKDFLGWAEKRFEGQAHNDTVYFAEVILAMAKLEQMGDE